MSGNDRFAPSAEAAARVGQHCVWRGNDEVDVSATITAAERVVAVITKADGSRWTVVRYRLKPTNGRRAFWTPGMPDQPLGTKR